MEFDLDKINAAIAKVSEQLKDMADRADKEIKAHQQLSAETRETVDRLLSEQSELVGRLKGAEQIIAMIEARGLGRPEGPKSLGMQVEESDGWRQFVANNGHGSANIQVVRQALTTDSGAAGGGYEGDGWIEHTRVPGIFTPGLRRLTVRDLLSWGTTTSNSIDFVRETGFTNSAAPVSENPAAGKPESQITFEPDQAPVATVAHWIHASRQILADVPMLRGYVDGRLQYGLKLKEEDQLLNGSGVGLNIDGIVNQATAYAQPGPNVQGETRIDRLRLALLQVELAEYYADGIILNPVEWAAIELTKDTQNRYVYGDPNMMKLPSLWGRPVVPTQAMAQDNFLTGAFAMGAQGWDREDMNVRVSESDQDDFIKNMVKILCEERLALTVYRPESFVTGTFAGVASTD